MEITKKGIEKLGFEFTDYDSETDMDYTFEKKCKKPKHYFCLIWQPISNEITLSEYDRSENGRGIFKIERLHQSRVSTIEALKNILKDFKC